LAHQELEYYEKLFMSNRAGEVVFDSRKSSFDVRDFASEIDGIMKESYKMSSNNIMNRVKLSMSDDGLEKFKKEIESIIQLKIV